MERMLNFGIERIVATFFFHSPLPLNEISRPIADWATTLAKIQTDNNLVPSTKLLDQRVLDGSDPTQMVELVYSKNRNLSVESIRATQDFRDFEGRCGCNVVLQDDNSWRRHKRLVVFDMDSTLIEQEVIDEIADFVGVKKEVAAITERAMNGELDFSESLRNRVALLKGVPSDVFDKLKSRITFTPGAKDLCRCLKVCMDCKLAVLSGGFGPLAEWVKDELGLDYAYANTLGISEDGKSLDGTVIGDIVNAERKAELLKQIAAKDSIPVKQAVAIGDGANDLLMMKTAGFGVAFNAKPTVQAQAPAVLNSKTLMDVFYVFGYSKSEQEKLMRESLSQEEDDDDDDDDDDGDDDDDDSD